MQLNNRYGYNIGDVVGDFTIIDMYRTERRMLKLKCVCNVCNKIKEIQPSNLYHRPHIFSHYCCDKRTWDWSKNRKPRCVKLESEILKPLEPRLKPTPRPNTKIITSIQTVYNIPSELYNALRNRWHSMIARCTNPNHYHYKAYGAKGITTEYTTDNKGFEGFVQDLGYRFCNFVNMLMQSGMYSNIKDAIHDTTLDRINNNKGYEISNLRWATRMEQCWNKSCVHDFIAISPDGKEYLANVKLQFADAHGLDSSRITYCLNGQYSQHKGWRFFYRFPEGLIHEFNYYGLFLPSDIIDERCYPHLEADLLKSQKEENPQ